MILVCFYYLHNLNLKSYEKNGTGYYCFGMDKCM